MTATVRAPDLFDDPVWRELCGHARAGLNEAVRIRLDFGKMPPVLRERALAITSQCVSCGAPINPVRERAQSKKSRIDGTWREQALFYGPACPTEVSPGCSRTKAARQYKYRMMELFAEGAHPAHRYHEASTPTQSDVKLREMLLLVCDIASKFSRGMVTPIEKYGYDKVINGIRMDALEGVQ